MSYDYVFDRSRGAHVVRGYDGDGNVNMETFVFVGDDLLGYINDDGSLPLDDGENLVSDGFNLFTTSNSSVRPANYDDYLFYFSFASSLYSHLNTSGGDVSSLSSDVTYIKDKVDNIPALVNDYTRGQKTQIVDVVNEKYGYIINALDNVSVDLQPVFDRIDQKTTTILDALSNVSVDMQPVLDRIDQKSSDILSAIQVTMSNLSFVSLNGN